jgi:hypothetical protein
MVSMSGLRAAVRVAVVAEPRNICAIQREGVPARTTPFGKRRDDAEALKRREEIDGDAAELADRRAGVCALLFLSLFRAHRLRVLNALLTVLAIYRLRNLQPSPARRLSLVASFALAILSDWTGLGGYLLDHSLHEKLCAVMNLLILTAPPVMLARSRPVTVCIQRPRPLQLSELSCQYLSGCASACCEWLQTQRRVKAI